MEERVKKLIARVKNHDRQSEKCLLTSLGHFRLYNVQRRNIFTQVVWHVTIRVDGQHVCATVHSIAQTSIY